jgi:hypothetical protein
MTHKWVKQTAELEDVESPRANSAAELKAWLDSFSAPEVSGPVSPHHDTLQDLFPEPLEAASQGPHIDPPAHPYEPFDWAAERLSGAQDRLSEHLSRLYADTE